MLNVTSFYPIADKPETPILDQLQCKTSRVTGAHKTARETNKK